MCIAEFFDLRSRLLILIWYFSGSDWNFSYCFLYSLSLPRNGICYWRVCAIYFGGWQWLYIHLYLKIHIIYINHILSASPRFPDLPYLHTHTNSCSLSLLPFLLPSSLSFCQKKKQNKTKPKDKSCPIIRKEISQKWWGLFCVGQLLLSLRPDLKCDMLSATPLGGTDFPSLGRNQVHIFLFKSGTLCLLLFFQSGIFVWLEFVWVLCILS